MPRYTFHLDNGHRITGDEETLPDDKAALLVAHATARDLSRNRTDPQKLRIVVTDESGIEVATVPLDGPDLKVKWS